MIITKDNSSLVSKCNLSELVSDRYAISFHVEYIKPILPKKTNNLPESYSDLNDFKSDIRSNFKQDMSILLIDILNNILKMTLNEHVPITS